MFEKKAEEIANKRCHEIMCFGHCSFSSPKHHRCGEWHREYNCAKEGIEFGYNKAFVEADKNLKAVVADFNKANEWQYVSEKGTPKKEGHYLVCLRNKNKDIFDCWIYYDKDVGWYSMKVRMKDIYAWKEIVLPKESK